MKLAESAGSRLALVLSAVATGALVAAAWPCGAAAERPAPREPVRAMHGCGARAATVATPPVEDPYVVTLRSAREGLAACIADYPELQVRLAIDLDVDGRVGNVEVRAISENLANVRLDTVRCVQAQVSHLQFPAAAEPKRISTFLRQ